MLLLSLLTVGVMIVVALSYAKEGLFLATANTFAVMIGSLMAANFYEPLADGFQPAFQGSFLEGLEDALSLVGLFCGTVVAMRVGILYCIGDQEISLPQPVLRGGGVVLGLLAGYIVAGFLICVLQTLPWQKQFLGFEPSNQETFSARAMPADQFWLKLMYQSSRRGLGASWSPEERDAKLRKAFIEFEKRYAGRRSE